MSKAVHTDTSDQKCTSDDFTSCFGTFTFFQLIIICKNIEVLEYIIENDPKSVAEEALKKIEIEYGLSDDVIPKDNWIYEANAIHLAAKFFPLGLELLLRSSKEKKEIGMEKDKLLDVRNACQHTPLHIAVQNDDSLSTRYISNHSVIFLQC